VKERLGWIVAGRVPSPDAMAAGKTEFERS
jgi:hypothetical protein